MATTAAESETYPGNTPRPGIWREDDNAASETALAPSTSLLIETATLDASISQEKTPRQQAGIKFLQVLNEEDRAHDIEALQKTGVTPLMSVPNFDEFLTTQATTLMNNGSLPSSTDFQTARARTSMKKSMTRLGGFSGTLALAAIILGIYLSPWWFCILGLAAVIMLFGTMFNEDHHGSLATAEWLWDSTHFSTYVHDERIPLEIVELATQVQSRIAKGAKLNLWVHFPTRVSPTLNKRQLIESRLDIGLLTVEKREYIYDYGDMLKGRMIIGRWGFQPQAV